MAAGSPPDHSFAAFFQACYNQHVLKRKAGQWNENLVTPGELEKARCVVR